MMYDKIIEPLQAALSAAEFVAASGGDKWTDEIKEVLEGVQRSKSAANFETRFNGLLKEHIPQDSKATFSFSDDKPEPNEIIIEKKWCCRRYPFDENAPEQSIKKAVHQWQFENMINPVI